MGLRQTETRSIRPAWTLAADSCTLVRVLAPLRVMKQAMTCGETVQNPASPALYVLDAGVRAVCRMQICFCAGLPCGGLMLTSPTQVCRVHRRRGAGYLGRDAQVQLLVPESAMADWVARQSWVGQRSRLSRSRSETRAPSRHVRQHLAGLSHRRGTRRRIQTPSRPVSCNGSHCALGFPIA